jgi:hypothetical protein
MQIKQVHPVPLAQPNMKLDVRPRYFSVASAALLALLVYANTSISFKEFGLQSQFIAVVPLIALWFIVVGIHLQSAIFASIALWPATGLWGVGFLALPGMALTLSDLLTAITFFLFIVRPPPLYSTKYTTLIWLLLGVCFASILLAANPTSHFGSLIRLVFSISLISIILASSGDTLKKPVFYATLLWPVIALSNVAGVEGLWRFISFGDSAAFSLAETGEVLLGSHTIVMNILFLLPLFVLLKTHRIFIFLVLTWLLVLVIFSYSRSLSIGIGTSLLIYFLFMIVGKWKIVKLALVAVLGAGLVFGVARLDYFNFTPDEGSKSFSSSVRIAKMLASWNTFTENPVFGIGYGAVGAIDTKSMNFNPLGTDAGFLDNLTNVKASSEFTPLQILAETGLAGGVISLFLIGISIKRTFLLLKNPEKPTSLKLTLMCLIVVFVTSFVGSNAFGNLAFLLAIPLIFDAIDLRGVPIRVHINRVHVSAKHGMQGSHD